MKRSHLSLSLVAISMGALATIVIAQQIGSSSASGKVDQAASLLHDGKPQEAREVIATIGVADPDYAAGQCYDLLCLHELKDYGGFLRKVDSVSISNAPVSSADREDLSFAHVDALFQFKQHEKVIPKAQNFCADYSASSRVAKVREYQTASLFEFGMKQTRHASQLQGEAFDAKWAAARAKLQEFLTLAKGYEADYPTLQKRSLKEDIWTARLTLGEEKAVLDEAENAGAQAVEQVSLLRVQLYQTFQPEQVERNLQLMGDFLRDYPDAKAAKRVRFDAAGLSYQRGKELMLAADAAAAGGDDSIARQSRNLAKQHFATMRALQAVVAEDEESGIGAPDVRDLQEDLLCSYGLEKDYSTVRSIASELAAKSAPGELEWIMGKEYTAIVLANQDPPQTEQAIAILDELLELGFKGKTENDRLMTTVARWRVTLALKHSDLESARRVIQQVQDGPCVKNIKKEFLRDYTTYAPASVAAETNTTEAK